ncbi:MAG: nucleotidyltransferase family protein [bacterium]
MHSRQEIMSWITLSEHDIRALGLRRLALFGSAARGESTEKSDLDFLVGFERKSFDSYMGLKELLEQMFSCHVDLVLADSIKPRLRPIILSEAVHAPGF